MPWNATQRVQQLNDTWKTREVWIFLCLIVIVNSVFIGGIAAGVLPEGLYNVGRFILLGLTLVTVVLGFRGLAGLSDLIVSLKKWRVNPLWYLLALVWAPALSILVLAAKSLLSGVNAFDLNTSLIQRPSLMRTVAIGSFIGEIVWVSYSISTLSRKYGTFLGAVTVGLFWTLWWTPMVWFGVGITPELPYIALLISMTGIALMCGFMYSHSGSAPVVFLLQFMVNTSFLVFPIVPTSGGNPTYLAFSITYLVAAVSLYVLFGPRPLFGRPVAQM